MKTTTPKTNTATHSLQVKSHAAQPFFQKQGNQPGSFLGNEAVVEKPFFTSIVQPKLSIGQPGDKYELEADAMAEQVVQQLSSGKTEAPIQRKCAECAAQEQEEGIAPKLQLKSIFESNEEPAGGQLQRKCEACTAEKIQPMRIQRMGEEEEPELQAKGAVPDLQAAADLESRLNSTKGGGSPLSDETRTAMESSFGTDFSGVRVHTNSGAVQMNQELGAQAFTHGSDVYFNSGKYDPGSTEGNRLLGHELTHVVQQGATEQSDGKQSRIQNRATIFDIQCSEESDLIDQNTSWGNLDETALGLVLVRRAQQGNFLIINRVLDQLGSTDRDDVSYEMIRQTSDETLSGFVHSAQGRQMLDRLYEELSSGSFGEEERQQANRIINAKEAAIAITSRPQDLGNIKIFPFKLPGITVFRDAPINAERRGEGKIWVNMPVRVLGTDGFRAETRTLPTEVFTSGIELPENETIGVRMYDLGGELHVRSALYLVQLANETDTQVLQSMAEVGAIGLTLGSGALVAGATEGSMAVRGLFALGISASRAASVVLMADRAAFAIGLITTAFRDHRGWILENFPSTGRQFMDYVEFANQMVAIYGMARFVIELPNLLRGFRSASSRWRQSRPEGQLNASQQQAIQEINNRTDEFLDGAQQIESARTPGSPEPAPGSPTSVQPPGFDSRGRLPRSGSRAVFNQGQAPTCGPVSCGMVIDTAGQPVDLATLVRAAGPDGTPLETMLQLLRRNRVVGNISTNLTIDSLAVATRQGNPAIAIIRNTTGTRASEVLHAVVVDGVTTRMGQRVVAIRDPWGIQYFETVDVFRQKFIGQGIVMDYTY